MQDDMGEDRSEPSGVGRTGPALDITPLDRSSAMPVEATISPQGDSANGYPQDNWQSLGDLARRLAEKAGGDA